LGIELGVVGRLEIQIEYTMKKPHLSWIHWFRGFAEAEGNFQTFQTFPKNG
jgi:hypothetical protein